MKNRLYILFCLFLSISSFAQISDFSTNYSFGKRIDFINSSEYLNLVQKSNLSNYLPSNSKNTNSTSFIFGVNFGFNVFKKENSFKKINPIYTVGYQYQDLTNVEIYSFEELLNTNTNIVSDWGQSIKTDTIIRTRQDLILSNSEQSISNGLMFSALKEKRFSFNYGVNLQLGIFKQRVIGNRENIDSYEIESFKVANEDYQIVNTYSSLKEEIIRSTINRSNFFMGLAVPLELDFRIGNKKEVLKRCHLILSYTPTFKYTYFKDISSFKAAYLHSFSLISFKYKFKTKENDK